MLKPLGLVLTLLMVLGCASSTPQGSTVTLITEEEAAQPDAPPEQNRAACTPAPPTIKINSPQNGQTYQQPVPVDVQFVPSEGASIDPAKVRLELLKLIRVDLTKKVRPYITPAGVSLPKAEIPRGKHRVEITIADTRGQGCSSVVEFTVR